MSVNILNRLIHAAYHILPGILNHLEHAGRFVKITGAAAVLDQNLPLPYRTDIIGAFPDGVFIAVHRGAIIIRGPGNGRLGVLDRYFHPAGLLTMGNVLPGRQRC